MAADRTDPSGRPPDRPADQPAERAAAEVTGRPLRVLVCGSRTFTDYQRLAQALDALAAAHPGRPLHLIHGNAVGADQLAGHHARRRGWPVDAYPADWATHGRAAGALRNQHMLDRARPELVIAFTPDQTLTRGTADIVGRARAASVPVTHLTRTSARRLPPTDRQPAAGSDRPTGQADRTGRHDLPPAAPEVTGRPATSQGVRYRGLRLDGPLGEFHAAINRLARDTVPEPATRPATPGVPARQARLPLIRTGLERDR